MDSPRGEGQTVLKVHRSCRDGSLQTLSPAVAPTHQVEEVRMDSVMAVQNCSYIFGGQLEFPQEEDPLLDEAEADGRPPLEAPPEWRWLP